MRGRQLFCALIVTLFGLICAQSPAGTCTPSCSGTCPCPTNPPPGVCVVHSLDQLKSALAGTNSCDGCIGGGVIPDHILIPAGVTICLGDSDKIDFYPQHSGLHLTIDGTVTWVGSASCHSYLFSTTDVTGLTIDGSGLLTSIYNPCIGIVAPECNVEFPPAWCVCNNICGPSVCGNGVCEAGENSTNCSSDCDPGQSGATDGDPYIATAFLIVNSHNIVISGTSITQPLRIARLGGMVDVKSIPPDFTVLEESRYITMRHLDGQLLAQYGVFINGDDVLLEDSHVHGPPGNPSEGTCWNQDAFRMYGDNLTIRDCSAHNLISDKQGFRFNHTTNVLVDGFVSDNDCWLGPNSARDDEGDALIVGTARNLKITKLEFQMGARIVDVVNLCTTSAQSIHIAKGSECYPTPPNPCPSSCFSCPLVRYTNNIHWANLSGDVQIDGGVPTTYLDYATISADSSLTCYGDITTDGEVNVLDLLAVIGEWGPCPNPQKYVCRADIKCPTQCDGDGVVNVIDLLAVISGWGPCPNGVTCGSTQESTAPKTLQECYDESRAQFPDTNSTQFAEAYSRCVQSLCIRGLLEDCD